jgi:hypothetical protein
MAEEGIEMGIKPSERCPKAKEQRNEQKLLVTARLLCMLWYEEEKFVGAAAYGVIWWGIT